ncbi:helix-turn-helix domain-containing protein [Streptomyces sp. 8N616]|uniref:helix-turn-helix domain-containing protein n=1 Tax=Streptomyces sp. 8N616 TaxID=3457414 RepID=UPI003FD082F9
MARIRAGRVCERCGGQLAVDNTTGVCGPCRKEMRGLLAAPPLLDDAFWASGPMAAALDSWHMGEVFRAYRTHPAHGRTLSQGVLGGWLGLTQTQLSRIENGPAPQELDRLIHWARVLRIPADLLWFKLPGSPGSEGRRAFLARTSGALAVLPALPSLRPDDLRHLLAAMQDARRYADEGVVRHIRQQLDDCAAEDGRCGPRVALPATLGLLAVVETMNRQAKPAVRISLLSVGSLVAEFGGWLYRDIGSLDVAEHWRDRAIEWAREAGDRPLQAYAMLRKSQGCWDTRDARAMGDLAVAVQDRSWGLPTGLRAEAVQQEARSRAMLGETVAAVERKLDEARTLLGSAGSGATGGSAYLPGTGYSSRTLELQAAMCLTEAGRPARAVPVYERCLASEALSYRDRAYFSALMAVTLAMVGEPAEAASVGLEVLRAAQATSSSRTLRELTRLSDRLLPWDRHPQVREFNAALRDTARPPVPS